VLLGDDVDLYKLPIPMSSNLRRRTDDHRRGGDRADPELGINSGIYRFIVK